MLLRNSLWHLSGSALPALVALATVPLMIHGLGLEGFGVVTLITSVVGYFGVLDANLSEARSSSSLSIMHDKIIVALLRPSGLALVFTACLVW